MSVSRVLRARKRAGLSQAELARRLDVQRSAVSHWECRNGRNPSIDHLRQLAQVTQVHFEWLATGRGAMALAPESLLDAVSAADALLIDDDQEMRLITALRLCSARSRAAIGELVDQLAAKRASKR